MIWNSNNQKIKWKPRFHSFSNSFFCEPKYEKLITKYFIRAHKKCWNNEARIRFNRNFVRKQNNKMCCFYSMLQTMDIVSSRKQLNIPNIPNIRFMFVHLQHFVCDAKQTWATIFRLRTARQCSLMSIHNAAHSRQIINIVCCWAITQTIQSIKFYRGNFSYAE